MSVIYYNRAWEWRGWEGGNDESRRKVQGSGKNDDKNKEDEVKNSSHDENVNMVLDY